MDLLAIKFVVGARVVKAKSLRNGPYLPGQGEPAQLRSQLIVALQLDLFGAVL